MTNTPPIGWDVNLISGASSSSTNQGLYPCLPNDDDDDKAKKSSSGNKHKRSSSSSSTSSSTSSDSSDADKKDKHQAHALKKKAKKEAKRLRREQRRQERREKRDYKKAKKLEKKQKKIERKASESVMEEADCGPPISLMNTKARAPQTKEDYDKIQSNIRRVVDPETGRTRLIKGEGEILEEIVTRDRHKAINKQATQADGEFFKSRTVGWVAD